MRLVKALSAYKNRVLNSSVSLVTVIRLQDRDRHRTPPWEWAATVHSLEKCFVAGAQL